MHKVSQYREQLVKYIEIGLNKKRIAKLLGVSRATLYRYLTKHPVNELMRNNKVKQSIQNNIQADMAKLTPPTIQNNIQNASKIDELDKIMAELMPPKN